MISAKGCGTHLAELASLALHLAPLSAFDRHHPLLHLQHVFSTLIISSNRIIKTQAGHTVRKFYVLLFPEHCAYERTE